MGSSNRFVSYGAFIVLLKIHYAVAMFNVCFLSLGEKSLPGSRSLSEIIASIQRSKLGIEGWTFGDLTIGLYLIYLRQASLSPFEDVKGVEVVSESTVRTLF